MKTWTKVMLCISLSFMSLFTCVGYASVSDSLSIAGSVDLLAPDYDQIVITDVTACAGTTATQMASITPYTNINSTITGKAGDTIVYKITAHNYSETETYVYTGPLYSDEYAAVAKKLTISASNDEQNTDKIPALSGSNFYEGTPVAPGQDIVFYATYTLNSNISAGEVLINFNFEPVIYTVTYIVNDEVYAVDCVVNKTQYDVTRIYEPTDPNLAFDYWMNAGSSEVKSIPADNEEDVNLYPSYVGVYTATFVDLNANVLGQAHYTRNNYSSVTNEANTIDIPDVTDCTFNYWQVVVNKNGTTTVTKLSEYKFRDDIDITIYPVYAYNGDVSLLPSDTNNNGVTDEYEVGGYNNGVGKYLVVIPDTVNGLKVTSIAANAFSSYEDIHAVVIPTTVEYIGDNMLAEDWGWFDSGETVTIYYKGSYEDWRDNVEKASGWADGLSSSTRIFFLKEVNGEYKVDLSQGYMQAKVSGSLNKSISWTHQGTITSAIKSEYDTTCNCKDHNNAADRPDRKYWTGV